MNYLFILHIPVLLKNGDYFLPQLAAIDLLAHRRLLSPSVHVILAAPVTERIDEPVLALKNIDVVPLKYENSVAGSIRVFLPNLATLLRAIGRSDFVHTGCGGFPFILSPCFQGHLIALILTKPRLFVMDCDLVGKLAEDQISHAPNKMKKIVWIAYAWMAWRLFVFCLKTTRASFLLGRGVVTRYGDYAEKPLEIYQPVMGLEDVIPINYFRNKLHEVRAGKPLRAILIGRLVHEKGIKFFLRALHILKKKGLHIEGHIVGDGPEKNALEKLSSELETTVHFHGALEWGNAVFTQLRKCHFFVVTHLTEEMTRTTFEGLGSGCALITSNTAALCELVRISQSGIVFKKGDPEALASGISTLLTKREALARHMENGLLFFQKNHRDEHIQRRLDFLSATIKELPWKETK